MSKLVYSGIYRDGAKIKTERDNQEVILTIRREFDVPENNFVMSTDRAVEMAYALLRAVKQINEEET